MGYIPLLPVAGCLCTPWGALIVELRSRDAPGRWTYVEATNDTAHAGQCQRSKPAFKLKLPMAIPLALAQHATRRKDLHDG